MPKGGYTPTPRNPIISDPIRLKPRFCDCSVYTLVLVIVHNARIFQQSEPTVYDWQATSVHRPNPIQSLIGLDRRRTHVKVAAMLQWRRDEWCVVYRLDAYCQWRWCWWLVITTWFFTWAPPCSACSSAASHLRPYHWLKVTLTSHVRHYCHSDHVFTSSVFYRIDW